MSVLFSFLHNLDASLSLSLSIIYILDIYN